MTRKRLNAYNCSIARTLDIVGDQWSILIVRDAFLGIETFSGFLNSVHP
jgi:DNA-binding HxlR family transcriptional regulator